jgi:aspartate carbamoyltransferase catalytic subunit
MGKDVTGSLEQVQQSLRETADLGGAIPELDVLYQTRIQAERFESPEEYERHRGVYVVTPEVMRRFPEHAILMHPLPRLGEIDPLVDADPRAAYFRQARNGLWVRMAVLDWAMGR